MSIKSRLKKIKILDDIVICFKWRERRVSYGEENPDKTFFVIRRNAPTTGLFSFVTINLGWIQYALEKGYIPVVDMCNTKNTYLAEKEVGRKNAWEFYFEQPCGYSLSDIDHSRHVILSSIENPPNYPGHDMVQNENAYQMWKKLAGKYLILKEEHRVRIEELYMQMFEGKRVLGVLCRGTDYKNLKPSCHPVQPELSEIMEKATSVMETYCCDYLYLATEDDEYLQEFQKSFGEKLRFLHTMRYQNTGNENINLLGECMNGQTPESRGTDYLMTIGLLSKCQCLVAGSVGGTYGALLLNESYEYRYVYNLGLYP